DVTLADGHGGTTVQTVAVTLAGSNDAPVITSAASAAAGAVTELTGITGSAALDTAGGTLTFTDLDRVDTHTATVAALGTGYLGSLTLGAIGDSTGGVSGSVPWA